MHVEFLVEEESCAEFLRILAPQLLRPGDEFRVHPFQGKRDLRRQLPRRLSGYAKWIDPDWRIVVLLDCDRDECRDLKGEMEAAAIDAGLGTKTRPRADGRIHVLNRIAIEELEAWFFGDIEALAAAYPGIPPTLARRQRYRNPDAIRGGTWESLQRELQKAGYYPAGMPKIEVARKVSEHMVPRRNQSASFRAFVNGIKEMCS
jgi:hypothetical protein